MIAREITVRFPNRIVLDRLSFETPVTGLVLVKGASGSGKTTLFRVIAGLQPADSGSLEGQGNVAYAFQEPRLLPWLTACENVALVREDKPAEEAKNLLLSFGFTPEETLLKPAELSGGMRQRVNLARAFYYEGDTLLLDEPLSGLDEGNKAVLLKRVLEEKPSRLILAVLHNDDWDSFADHILRVEK